MKILLTGANGYIGRRLIPALLDRGHEIICVVRDASRLALPASAKERVEILEHDFKQEVPDDFPTSFDAAYFLIHSMRSSISGFSKSEEATAKNFVSYINRTECKQVVYLGGIDNAEELSEHLKSRQLVGEILSSGQVPVTQLKAGIIVGSGSASFEIIRDLVEKLPVMIAPKWLKTKCQPIAIRNVIQYLIEVIEVPETRGKSFEIGGPDILSYKDMLMEFARVRKLKRFILSIPIMTPNLSSHWLYFMTSTTYPLAVNLVHSMKVPVVVKNPEIQELIPIQLLTYEESIKLAFSKIAQNLVLSSWKDSRVAGAKDIRTSDFIEVPTYGCFKDEKRLTFDAHLRDDVIANIFAIGGSRGWYYGNVLWRLRGWMDKMVGGVGLRRGRRDKEELVAGDALDFWRVIKADKQEGTLLLFAEMKLPGEAWLSFHIRNVDNGKMEIEQVATFRPTGLAGRLYWFSVLPFHAFIFKGMIKNILREATENQ
ncbi:MAG: SDR family oxidoreductase [Flavobacteriia bacterium]|nr:SDR family oxidoreductase [Flavobacteriia bacterium]